MGSLPPAFLPRLPPRLSRPRRRAAPGKASGDSASTSLQLRWTLRAQRDLLWERNLRRPLRPVLVGRRPSTLSRLEPLRGGGGGGQTRGGNAQLLSRSRPSSAGSTRTETRITRLLLLT